VISNLKALHIFIYNATCNIKEPKLRKQ